MRKIYSFDAATPPKLNEKMLREEIRYRNLKKQTALLRFASLFVTLSLILFGFVIVQDSIVIAIISIAAACYSMIANGVVSVIFYKKKRSIY